MSEAALNMNEDLRKTNKEFYGCSLSIFKSNSSEMTPWALEKPVFYLMGK